MIRTRRLISGPAKRVVVDSSGSNVFGVSSSSTLWLSRRVCQPKQSSSLYSSLCLLPHSEFITNPTGTTQTSTMMMMATTTALNGRITSPTLLPPMQKPLPVMMHVRCFSRRPRQLDIDEQVEDGSFELTNEIQNRKAKDSTISSIDMELVGTAGTNAGHGDDDDDDEDDYDSYSNFVSPGYDEENDNEDDYNYDDAGDADPLYSAEYRKKQEEIRRELDSRTGYPWTDPYEITEEQWMSTTLQEDLPDFSPELVSRISQERVHVYPDGIPTLEALASMELPEPASPHPGLGQTKAYAKHRNRTHQKYVAEKVRMAAKDRVKNIIHLSDWNDKQDAIDELFEALQPELKASEEVLGSHPLFGRWVEQGLEEYLRTMNENGSSTVDDNESLDTAETSGGPVFMDCFDRNEADGGGVVPRILSPLAPHSNNGPGRMVEEWELSAHKKTKRILLRDATKTVARTLTENESSRIFIHGRKGVGKTAVLASIVASARKSGYIVLYLPDGDRLRKNGYFVTPNAQREGMFDLQNLSQEACQQLLDVHIDDMDGLKAGSQTLSTYFKDTQWKRAADHLGIKDDDEIELGQLLKYAMEKKNHAPMCYSVVVDCLTKQDDKPFLMVMDEFNSYFDHGHYFHMAYDDDVREAIPYDKINLFEHPLGIMGLSENSDEIVSPRTPSMHIRRGGIVVGMTESRAVRRVVTDGLIADASNKSSLVDTGNLHVVEVPRFSDIEVQHILANYEATGVGKFRLDRGKILMNKQEVEYLKMTSGSVGQRLLDASII